MMNNLEQLDYENKTRSLIKIQITFYAKKHGKVVRKPVDATCFVPKRAYAKGFPIGWTYEIRFRTTGKSAGKIDKYYYYGEKRYRSIKEIQADFKDFQIRDKTAWNNCWKLAEAEQRPLAMCFVKR